MIEEILQELSASIGKAHEALRRDLGKLRTGRANAALLDGIRVEYYGSFTPIAQMANVAVPEARMLTVKPWDKSTVKAIEKAIVEAGLGLNPQTDGDFIRIPMPHLSEERRKELVKLGRKSGEECKIAIRKSRHDAKDMLDALSEGGDAGEDEVSRALGKVEEIIKAGTAQVDDIVAKKEKDILEI